MEIRPVGSRALLVVCADEAETRAWHAELWRRRDRGDLDAVDVVPGARTVLVDGLSDPDGTASRVAGWAPPPPAEVGQGARVSVPVVFDGADLESVAGLWGVDAATVVERLTGAELSVAFCGFAPGFAYLAGLPAELAIARLPTPRAKVPAGSVALAGEYAGIYPNTSPGGWRIVGRTDASLFDVDREPPAVLTPGTHVRLEAA
jgi:KipI family sensor histidine kinase inhibitor